MPTLTELWTRKSHAGRVWQGLRLALGGLALMLSLLVPMGVPQLAGAVQAVPELTARVIDQTGTLGATEQAALSDELAQLEADTGTQMVVLMVGSTEPEDIFSYSNRVANSWKLGRADVGDGGGCCPCAQKDPGRVSGNQADQHKGDDRDAKQNRQNLQRPEKDKAIAVHPAKAPHGQNCSNPKNTKTPSPASAARYRKAGRNCQLYGCS